jgi:hypothetical protein
MWRSRFWRWHLLLAACLTYFLASVMPGHHGVAFYLIALVAALAVVIAMFAAWPQLRFKALERTLHVDHDGWSTTIGAKSASLPWSAVAAIEESANSVVIAGISGNALVIPLRAFADAASMHRFATDARAWHRSPGNA